MLKPQVPNDPSFSLTTKEEWILLVLMAHRGQELYGLRIVDEIKQQSYGEVDMATGTLYPILRRLEKRGLISSFWENESQAPSTRGGARRRYYEISDSGIVALKEAADLRERLGGKLVFAGF